MNKLASFLFCLCLYTIASGQEAKPVSLKSVLLQQLQSTYDAKNWFVPIKVALQDVTVDQANWRDSSGNHSVGQLASHLLFWNERVLKQLRNEPLEKFSGNNDETFVHFEKEDWAKTLKHLDDVLTGLEQVLQGADDKKLAAMAETIANVSTHNAYHTGQILYVRKLQKSWDGKNGVK